MEREGGREGGREGEKEGSRECERNGFRIAHLTLCAFLSVRCLFWCLYMMTMAMVKKPMLARKISITGARRDHTNDV